MTDNAFLSTDPSLVWTGSGYGVAWVDYRDGNAEIYFARLDALGAKLTADIRVTEEPHLSLAPSLVCTGSGYGVSWVDHRNGNAEIYFALLREDGTENGDDHRVTNDFDASTDPSLVWTGHAYTVSWVDQRNVNGEIYFTTLSSSGAKVGPGPCDERRGHPVSPVYRHAAHHRVL